MKARWTARALIGLEQITAFLEDRNPAAARRILTTIVEAGDSLPSFPYRYPPRGAGIRQMPVGGTPYLIRYVVTERRHVVILAVRHGRQDEAE